MSWNMHVIKVLKKTPHSKYTTWYDFIQAKVFKHNCHVLVMYGTVGLLKVQCHSAHVFHIQLTLFPKISTSN